MKPWFGAIYFYQKTKASFSNGLWRSQKVYSYLNWRFFTKLKSLHFFATLLLGPANNFYLVHFWIENYLLNFLRYSESLSWWKFWVWADFVNCLIFCSDFFLHNIGVAGLNSFANKLCPLLATRRSRFPISNENCIKKPQSGSAGFFKTCFTGQIVKKPCINCNDIQHCKAYRRLFTKCGKFLIPQ